MRSLKETRLSQLLKDEDVLVLGNKMRQERNVNLYDGGFFLGEKDLPKHIFTLIKQPEYESAQLS